MAKKLKSKIPLIELIVGISVIAIVIFSAAPNQFFAISGQAAASTELAMPFAVDAWGYAGWGDCSTQDKGKTWPDQYCQAKGYGSAETCYHANSADRWRWAGTAQSPQKGTYTAAGIGFTKVKCMGVTDTATTTPSTLTLEKSATNAGSINLDFGKPYSVTKIDYEGVPGGEFCGVGIGVTAWNSIDNKYTQVSYSGRVDTHKTIKKTVIFTAPMTIRSLRAKPSPDSDPLTNDCTNIDRFKATITYNPA